MVKYNLSERKEREANYRDLVSPALMDDLKERILDLVVMQKKYKDGVIRTGTINNHDLGTNPAVKPYHYQGDPDQ